MSHTNKLHKGKTPGIDGLLNSVLLHLPINIIFYFTCIIYAILKHHYFSAFWKSANFCPMSRRNTDHKFPSKYRPISLLCSLRKIIERIIFSCKQ